MRVLIVEDSDSIVRMIQALMAARGFDVRSASSGARGLEEAFAWKPHVILLDINLPGAYDGIQVCEKIRADKDIKDTPVIIISAMNDDEIKRRAHEAGATAYYEKPFSPLALLKEIESLQRRSGQW
ncbi:MAG: response regulator transcription factor [Labilithrix sp.]|nr:response regulator transcription factor [Labilithrix sp.]MBX3211483.1 response regulator transcription factor [Labilithrix sp.]MBX3262753.1 response regulator transcription factor [Labilithrix sp.]